MGLQCSGLSAGSSRKRWLLFCVLLSACLAAPVPGKEVSKSLLPRKKKKTLNLSEYTSRGAPPVEWGEMACESSGLEES